jgi:glycosyltransferase involved in cell wall biosynthesis
VIIPAFNEEGSVGKIVSEVRCLGLRVLVVDDHSSDFTRDEALDNGATVLTLVSRLGSWGAIQTGFRYALKNDYKYGITMDADGQHAPECISYLLCPENLKKFDVIIGSCPERVSALRKIAWKWFRRISSAKFEDLTSGMRVYNQSAMQLMLDKKAYMFDYQDMGVLLLLRKYGFRIKEVPVHMLPRKIGHSRVFDNWFKVCRYMAVTTSLSACKYRQKSKRRVC